MVVNRGKPKPKEINRSEKVAQMLEELSQESEDVISLAYFYAKNFEQFGEDVTTRWKNAVLQNDALNRAYAKGWEDCSRKIRS